LLGKIFNYSDCHMKKFIAERNQVVKEFAEIGNGKRF
jgi:hypothetical protein